MYVGMTVDDDDECEHGRRDVATKAVDGESEVRHSAAAAPPTSGGETEGISAQRQSRGSLSTPSRPRPLDPPRICMPQAWSIVSMVDTERDEGAAGEAVWSRLLPPGS